jgi:membrane associated rhomboid family serine protease
MSGNKPILTAGSIALTIGVYGFDGLTDRDLLFAGVLDRSAPFELWRSVTAHLLHTDLNHLVWNASVLLLVGWMIEHHSRILLLLAAASGMAAVNVWFFLLADAGYYCGWSGALNTLLLCALYTLYSKTDDRVLSVLQLAAHHLVLALIALCALAKNLYELHSGVALLSNTIWSPAPGAHIAGWLAGLIVVLALHLKRPDPHLRNEISEGSCCGVARESGY